MDRRYCAALVLAVCYLVSACLPRVANASAAVPDHGLDADFRQQIVSAAQDADGFGNQFQAQVWLIDMSTRLKKYMPKPGKRADLLKEIHQQAKRNDLDPQLVLAVIHVESRFQHFAISSSGARGLMQIMPFWKKNIGRSRDNLFRMQTNIRYGCSILAHYLDVENGNKSRALARYNGSLGSQRYPRLVNQALRRHWAVR